MKEIKDVLVCVYDDKEQLDKNIYCVCFIIEVDKLDLFLSICNSNQKYVIIEVDYSEVK